MNQKKKALLSVLLAASMLTAAGCSSGSGSASSAAPSSTATSSAAPASSAAASSEAAPAAAEPEELTLPITTEDITLTFWADIGKAAGAVKTLNDNLTYQEIEKRTGVKLEFQHPPVGSAKEQFNLLIASRNLPDLIQYDWLTVPGGPGAYIRDKVIIPLNEPVAQWAPNLTKVLAENEKIRKQQEMDDGTYYVFPAVYADRELAVSNGPTIRYDWFQKLGINKKPTTIDDWTEMLRKVRSTDLNGNGAGDVQGIFLQGKESLDGQPFIIGAWGIRQEFYNDNGTVKFGGIQPEYKEFLAVMNSWYNEGLIDPESLAGTAKIQDTKLSSNKLFAYIGGMGNGITRYTAMMKPENPDFQLMPLPYPVLNEGDVPTEGQEQPAFNNGGVAITTACQYVREATKLFDYNYSEEGHILTNWGVEGVTYETGPDGNLKYTDLILNNPDGLSREQAMAKYTIWQTSSAVMKYKDVLNQRDSLPEQIEGRKEWLACTNRALLPPLTPTQEESSEYASLMNEIRTYTTEMFNQFVSGKTSLDKFDDYVQTLKGMGIERAIELTQAQLDRYDSRP
ncbi:MAG: extracellular solute-binding protein [Provencibacterium sp.]|jgi:putative aldouronate transport system substrate-binding protein|nr:extracellular solute-binding protein [Provencibacterium sp.]